MDENAITLSINGRDTTCFVRNAATLLYILREKLGLTGAKPGCLNGDCGACTIDVDGEPMKSCLMLAVEGEGKKITTIEGMKQTTIQSQFIEKFAFQCGYCTPGFIMNCHALIQKHPDATDDMIKNWMESNICRCTGYKEIEDAVKTALRQANQNTDG
ncbi:(2Fe-2S)-binding protein [Virgibacillus sp. 179-BFC.A HS]|uniref:(2Fe-2S)-binding protein n=1 Tax=Tigheibacillus jepli TaxID=3035914 RepID=A0ABU5CKZ1_9BACI|nr:(2Fe-2S)-binding protein [Virgibacillus sp. 179-BFC.A HS]MDY0406150.1 (2Fe-2S)-binding protein [Virgibacillus sp. 179-BFC.A HS]